MTDGRVLRPPAFDRRQADAKGGRGSGARHPAVERRQHPNAQIFGVGFHTSHDTKGSMFLHFAIEGYPGTSFDDEGEKIKAAKRHYLVFSQEGWMDSFNPGYLATLGLRVPRKTTAGN